MGAEVVAPATEEDLVLHAVVVWSGEEADLPVLMAASAESPVLKLAAGVANLVLNWGEGAGDPVLKWEGLGGVQDAELAHWKRVLNLTVVQATGVKVVLNSMVARVTGVKVVLNSMVALATAVNVLNLEEEAFVCSDYRTPSVVMEVAGSVLN